MKYYLLIIALTLFSCNLGQRNSKQETKKGINNKCFVYPSEVDSLHLQDLYDSARWYIYATYCDKLYQPKDNMLPKYYFGQLELRFSDLVIKGDTVIINYDFFDNNGNLILPSIMKTFKQLVTGVGFNMKNRKKIFMESSSGFSVVTVGGEDNRYENPLQPKVLAYIKSNWDKLNDCFREIAELKGIKK
ncbi:MAG: hypothetical protein IT254_03975 [Chitinophagaceae bacterium]|mgnify:CR=1 FL=1|nr:hypothetical protein [Bacteroidota bacterium]MCC6257456.1 hypothetical protein [Chitinophagaceae bacterium]MCW5916511.1 hypothetical protein [Ferruginibacter sp.]